MAKNTFNNRMHMKSEVLYVDESGNPGTTAVQHNMRHPFFIISFCYCKNPSVLKRECMKLLNRLHKKHLYPKKIREVKFYPFATLQKHGIQLTRLQQTGSRTFIRYVKTC